MPGETKARLLSKAVAGKYSDYAMANLLVHLDDSHSVCTNCVKKTWYTLVDGLWQSHDGDQLFDTYRLACDAVLAFVEAMRRKAMEAVESERDIDRQNKAHLERLKMMGCLDSNSKTKKRDIDGVSHAGQWDICSNTRPKPGSGWLRREAGV